MKACKPGQPAGRRILFPALIFSLVIPFGCRAEGVPVFLEAEAIVARFAKIRQDSDASGGAYITANPAKFIPMVALKIPPEFDRVTIWARTRGCVQGLKTDINGEAKDLKWQRRVTEGWEWYNFGTYSRAELGEMVRFIKAPGDEGGIDAIFLDPTNTIDPRAEENLKRYEAHP